MEHVTPDQLDARLTAALRARGQRVTPQRVVLHRTLHALGRHATVEEVVREAADHLPGVSAPTAYAVLDLLDELGLARKVTVPGGPVLYDPQVDDHVHLLCRTCGRVEDVDARADAQAAIAAAQRAGATVSHAAVVLEGHCPACTRAR
jgi:Fe2+ or Zn2+ uptake regulation protein